MSQEEALFEEILAQTCDRTLVWTQLSRRDYSEFILNAHQVTRIYHAPFKRNGADYQLVLVEKKEDEGEFFVSRLDGLRIELLVLDADKLIITLSEQYLRRGKMLVLLGAVSSRCDLSAKLFRQQARSA
jgi:hypothetical protein